MILEISAAAVAGSLIGLFACAVLTAGQVSDLQDKLFHTECELEAESAVTDALVPKLRAANAAHQRATDALQEKTDRIERALAQVTDGANATVKRMARILSGDA